MTPWLFLHSNRGIRDLSLCWRRNPTTSSCRWATEQRKSTCNVSSRPTSLTTSLSPFLLAGAVQPNANFSQYVVLFFLHLCIFCLFFINFLCVQHTWGGALWRPVSTYVYSCPSNGSISSFHTFIPCICSAVYKCTQPIICTCLDMNKSV